MIGPRAWRILHLTGGYYLWFQFMVSFGKRIPACRSTALFLIPLLAVMALRLIAMASVRTPRHRASAIAATRARHAGGIRPRRLAMILSTVRFGSTDVTDAASDPA